jgi:nucleoside-diphosphate-sugar epimerase
LVEGILRWHPAAVEEATDPALMQVLITGGAGFIGSHLALALQKHAAVRILDNLRTGDRRRLEGFDVDFVKASVLDTDALGSAMSGVDIVFHLAAMVGVQESMDNPRGCIETNTIGTFNVLEVAAEAGVRKLVFASSAAIYGDDPPVPTPESAPPRPKSPYAMTKLDGEHLCEMFLREKRLKTAALRFFNVFGPGQDPDGPYAAAVPTFLWRAMCGEAVTIFGDGEQTRDFVYVKDIVSSLLFIAEKSELTGAYNCGYGHQTTINEIAHQILELTQSPSRLIHLPARLGDVRHSRASTEKLRASGWRPVSGLEEGLRETVEAYRQESLDSTRSS